MKEEAECKPVGIGTEKNTAGAENGVILLELEIKVILYGQKVKMTLLDLP